MININELSSNETEDICNVGINLSNNKNNSLDLLASAILINAAKHSNCFNFIE